MHVEDNIQYIQYIQQYLPTKMSEVGFEPTRTNVHLILNQTP